MILEHAPILVATIMLLVGLGAWEHFVLGRARSKIRVRIHVNGTRGKSSVTRLIASALREAGIRTFAKTTGTLPRMIFPDGKELPVFRPAKANIIEQRRILRVAAAENAEVLVMECMALQPLLQSISELKIVRSTHSVITNARPDHLDVMGPTPQDVARALCGMICRGGSLFTAEREHLPILRDAAADRDCKVVSLDDDDVSEIQEPLLARFCYTEHAENVALALKVCESLGVDRDLALEGMTKTPPDPGALTRHDLDFFGRRLVFFNGFAANDPVSTEKLWNLVLDQTKDIPTRIAVFNCRSDRADRSAQLAEALAGWRIPTWVVLMGTGTQIFARFAERAGFDIDRLVFVEGLRVEEIFERLVELSGDAATIMGMGNIGGQGLDVARYFKNRERLVPGKSIPPAADNDTHET
jgi:poly-gamma-glutamate synthase PgsB/CapB